MSNTFQVNNTKLNTHYGEFDFFCFAWGPHEEDNVLCLVKHPFPQAPLVRIQSACYTAEIFRSLDCDCHEQLEQSLERIQSEGGLLLYMLCDGRGAGLLKKIQGLELGRTQGLDTSAAYDALGIPQDPRTYDRAAEILKHFSIKALRLLTNNPRKLGGLEAAGLHVERAPLEVRATPHSESYLKTKTLKMGHMMDQFKSSNNTQ